jgi:hypothetical protein
MLIAMSGDFTVFGKHLVCAVTLLWAKADYLSKRNFFKLSVVDKIFVWKKQQISKQKKESIYLFLV